MNGPCHRSKSATIGRWSLATRDAHGLYRQFGFGPPTDPKASMEIVDRDVYSALGEEASRA